MPADPFDGTIYIRLDRTHQGRDGLRPQAPNSPGKQHFAGDAGCPARFSIEMIDRLPAGVDQIAAGVPEHGQEILVTNRGIHHLECIPKRPVQPGIAIVEKSSRSRGCLSNEQQTHRLWPVTPPDGLPLF